MVVSTKKKYGVMFMNTTKNVRNGFQNKRLILTFFVLEDTNKCVSIMGYTLFL